MSAEEAFTFIEEERSHQPSVRGEYDKGWSGAFADVAVQLIAALQKKHPDLIITSVPANNVNLLQFAAAGYAKATLDQDAETPVRLRGYVAPPPRGGVGYVADFPLFVRYNYEYNGDYFVLYLVKTNPIGATQFVLKEPQGDEKTTCHSSATDKLLQAIGDWLTKLVPGIWVYDNYWYKDTKLGKEIQKANWDDVILDESKKKDLRAVSKKFFDSRDIYKKYGVPWKRGLIFHGPVGNGKTITIKAMIKELIERDVEALYVKTASSPFAIGQVFSFARELSPCILILEDIETIVNERTRSYFFNQVDGLENNDGLFMVASTNYLERLDPGLSKRPSRFDRKYLFPLPSKRERRLYALYWHEKLKDELEFPKKLCSAIAVITDGFSFAYLKEAFVTTLLDIANHEDDDDDDNSRVESMDEPGDNEDLNKYKFWRYMKKTVDLLRKDMDSGDEELAVESLSLSDQDGPHQWRKAQSAQRSGDMRVESGGVSGSSFPPLALKATSDKGKMLEWGMEE